MGHESVPDEKIEPNSIKQEQCIYMEWKLGVIF